MYDLCVHGGENTYHLHRMVNANQPFQSAGVGNVLEQSMHVKDALHLNRCWSNFGFFTTSLQPAKKKTSAKRTQAGRRFRKAGNLKLPSHLGNN